MRSFPLSMLGLLFLYLRMVKAPRCSCEGGDAADNRYLRDDESGEHPENRGFVCLEDAPIEEDQEEREGEPPRESDGHRHDGPERLERGEEEEPGTSRDRRPEQRPEPGADVLGEP